MKRFTIGSLLFIIVFVIGACSNDSGGKKETTGSENETENNELVYLATQDIDTIDPAKFTEETSTIMVLNLYDPFLYPNVEEDSMDPAPHIAESWEIDEDGLKYTFKLREDIIFQSGNELTASDVIYSMERMLNIDQGFSWLWDGVLTMDGITEVDDYTIEIELEESYGPFLSTLTQFFIVDSQLIEENVEDDDFGQEFLNGNSAGSGPYSIEDWKRGDEINLTQFEDYWRGWDDNQIKDIKYMLGVTEEATQKTMMRSGEADFVDQWMSVSSQKELEEEDGIILEEGPSTQLYYISLNNQKAPLDDENFRKAISYGFDYETNNQEILKGAEAAQGPVPLLVSGHSDEAEIYEYDIEKAKGYLEKSSYDPDEITLEFYYVSDIEEERQTGLLLQSNLEELGIEVELEGVPWTQITEITKELSTTPHMIANYDTLKFPHIDSHTYGFYHPSSQGSNRTAFWYEDDEVTKLLEKARSTVDMDEQMEYYKDVQNIVVDDAVSIFVANPTHRIVFNSDIEGYNYVGLLGYDTAFYDFNWK